jgi:hypothetical protein
MTKHETKPYAQHPLTIDRRQTIKVADKLYTFDKLSATSVTFSRVVMDMTLVEIDAWKKEQDEKKQQSAARKLTLEEYLGYVVDLIESNGTKARVRKVADSSGKDVWYIFTRASPTMLGFYFGQIDVDYDVGAEEMGWIPTDVVDGIAHKQGLARGYFIEEV